MPPRLVAYRYVRPGFEMVIDNPDVEMGKVWNLWALHHENRASQFAARIHSLRGERKGAKEWLAARLLKTITDNQRWHKAAELIDRFREATSWFRDK